MPPSSLIMSCFETFDFAGQLPSNKRAAFPWEMLSKVSDKLRRSTPLCIRVICNPDLSLLEHDLR